VFCGRHNALAISEEITHQGALLTMLNVLPLDAAT